MSRPLRILYLHQYFTVPNGAGGTRSYEFARRLIAAGHEVQMVTSSAYLTSDLPDCKARVLKQNIAGIPCIIINQPYSNTMSYAARLIAFFSFAIQSSWIAMRAPSDVIFATSTPLTIAIPAIIGKSWQKIPMVFEIRDLWPELPIAVGALRNPFLIWAARWLEKITYQNSTQIVALSPGMAEGIKDSGYDSQDIHVIPNSCDIELFDVLPQEGLRFRKQFEWLGNEPLVIYAGTLGKINGVGYLARLAKAMQDLGSNAKFMVIGRESAEADSVCLLAQKLKVLNHNFFMVPQLPKKQMPAALSAADVATSLFIDLPEMQNNSANKFFDALASGTPVAINYGGWQSELLSESGAGIVLHSTDIDEAAHTLNEFLLDKSRKEQSAAAALELGKRSFNRDDMAKRLERILQAAVNNE